MRRMLTVLAAAVLVLAACSGEDEPDTAVTSTTQGESSTDAEGQTDDEPSDGDTEGEDLPTPEGVSDAIDDAIEGMDDLPPCDEKFADGAVIESDDEWGTGCVQGDEVLGLFSQFWDCDEGGQVRWNEFGWAGPDGAFVPYTGEGDELSMTEIDNICTTGTR